LDIPGVETATGNQVSAEFNLVYRWHSAISARDEQWTEEQYARLFPGKDPKTMDLPTFLEGLKAFEESIPNEPECRDYFHGQATRMKGHPYDDDFLVDILTGSIEDCANSFGAQRVPVILRAVEILGIQQGRSWNLATLNEFRKHFGLIPHKRFEDINPDEHVAEQLRRLYDSPDLVELYPGLVAEDAKVPLVPGAGLTPPFTVSRAVLSDAVALVRGDRFYTIDYHPKQLTNWGFSLVESDTAVDHGCVFYKLFLSAFPNHFEPNSVYAHYPLTIPKEMKRVLTGLGKADQYTFTRPKRIAVPQVIFSYETAKKVLADNKTFLVPWGPAMHSLMGPLVDSFALAGDGPANQESRKKLSEALYIKNWEKQINSYYIDKSTQILKARSYTLGGTVNRIDIIRDVGNRVPVHLAADLFNLHLKTADHPMGALTEDQLYVILLRIFTDIFLDLDPASSFPLRQRALQAVQALGEVTKLTVHEVDGFSGLLNELKSLFSPHTENSPLPDFGSHIIQRLLDSGREVHNFAWGYIISTISGLAPPQGQVFAQLLEYYLTEGKEHLDKMRDLALKDDDGSFNILMHYVMEGARLGGETAVFRRVARDASIEDSGRTLKVKQGDTIMVNFRVAGRDPSVFPDPDKVKTDRPLEAYIHQGYGPHQCIGLDMAKVCLTSLVKVVLKECPGLRPAPGRQGVVQKVATVLGPENLESKDMRFHRYLSETGDRYWPVPASMKVDWDK
jgi:cytochrome P450